MKKKKNFYPQFFYFYFFIVLDDASHNDDDPNPIRLVDQAGMNDMSPDEEPKPESEQESTPVPELDPDILSALGEATEETPKFGPKINENLTRLWLPILSKGMNKVTKDRLLKEYIVPENCPLLQAPKLNPEISAAVNEGTRIRDKRVEGVQQQLGHGIAALNMGLNLLLDDKDKVQAIKFLSDSCRLFCDLHFEETEARKKFVTPGLDKSFINIMQDSQRDEMLFGSKLSEKIKATKVIEKHGLQIKKPAPNFKTPSTYQTISNRPPHLQGNWRGPPRFSSNRGGRGGPRRSAPAPRKPQAGTTQQKSSAQSKQRAAAQQ